MSILDRGLDEDALWAYLPIRTRGDHGTPIQQPPRHVFHPRPVIPKEHPHAWRDRAACAGQDTRRYYPERGERAAADLLLLCWGSTEHELEPCPVREACLAWANANNEPGLWGGLTESQRKRRRRQ